MLTQWAKNITLHSSVSPRLPWGILGWPLSSIGLLSPTQYGFYGFLLRTGPLLTSNCTYWSFTDGVLYRLVPQLPSQKGKSLNMQVLPGPDSKSCITVLNVPWCFSGQSPSSPCDNRYYNPVNGSPPPCGWAADWLPKCQPVTSSILAKACGFVVNIWSWTLGSWPLAVSEGAMQVAQVWISLSVSNYHGSHIGYQVLSQGFPPFFSRRVSSTGPMGI